MTFDQLFE